ncbi:spermidine synthase [Nonomuraea sp. SBT364]|uniref:spermidine synthase n=1 Tax=Nonomuraea sp. SBT364 TaxID=1580530 RepID=UPI00066EDD31|nr:spermidine synthase [Nonomuraea sp. SBT364]
MGIRFEEIDFQPTALGGLSLRRRREPSLGTEVHEIKLDDDFLMSSLFTEAEIQLATLGLAAARHDRLDVAVGGLGLGYTARAVLREPRVRSLVVIDALAEVIGWHQRGLLPLGPELTGDQRCRLLHGDFFAAAATDAGLDPATPGRRFHAILVDIDHAPDHVLHPSHAAFYEPDGLRRLATHLHPGGVFALWSNDPPHSGFLASLGEVFTGCRAHEVSFHNFLQGRPAANTIYLATRPE